MDLKNILAFILIIIISACNQNPLNVDASKVKIDVDFVNLDSVFVHSDTSQLLLAHHQYKKNIREIYEYELGYALRIGDVSDTAFVRSIQLFNEDPYISRLEKRISEKFRDLSSYKREMNSGFQHLKYHFPKGKIPENIVFMNSFFSSNVFCTEKQIGIGLERYLGSKTDVIKELPSEQFFEWIKEGMESKYLSRDAICAWVMTHYVAEVDGNLAENIVRWGKILYLTQAAFPDTDPAIIMRYSEGDYDWAIKNEYSLWQYLVKEKMLFTINDLNKNNFLNEGPFTVGLPEKGPDRLGQFIGLRMILKYMAANDVTLEKLLNTPYAEILVEYEID